MRGIRCPECGGKLKVINPTGVEIAPDEMGVVSMGVIVRRRDCRNPECPAALEGKMVSLETVESVRVTRYRKRKKRPDKCPEVSLISETSFTGANMSVKTEDGYQKQLVFDG